MECLWCDVVVDVLFGPRTLHFVKWFWAVLWNVVGAEAAEVAGAEAAERAETAEVAGAEAAERGLDVIFAVCPRLLPSGCWPAIGAHWREASLWSRTIAPRVGSWCERSTPRRGTPPWSASPGRPAWASRR